VTSCLQPKQRLRALHSLYLAKKRQTGIRDASNWCRKPHALPFMQSPRSQCRHTVCALWVSCKVGWRRARTRHPIVFAPAGGQGGRWLHRLPHVLLEATLKVERKVVH
jgi:hypothetical protein